MMSNWIGATALALLLGGCGLTGQQSDRLLVFGVENYSEQPYSMHAKELSFPLPGTASASLLAPCEAGYSEKHLRPPFEVRVGPGSLEETGDGSNLPVVLTDADFPEDGTGWWLTVERDGAVTLRRIAAGEQPNQPRFLCG